MYETTVPVTKRMDSGPRLVQNCSQYLNAHRLIGLDRLVMSRTTTSVDPRNVTRASWAPAGIVEEHEKATGLGVVGDGATGLGHTNGVGDAAGLGEVTGLGFGEGLAIATGVLPGVCRALGFALPQAANSKAVATTAAFIMLVITPSAIGRYDLEGARAS
jgi:hypothetical protein